MIATARSAVVDCLLLTQRNLRNTLRIPQALVFNMMQPILFVLLFSYVFGEAIPLPGGANYREYVIIGIFVQTVAFGGMTTGAGLADDMRKGLIDRFRSIPMTQSAVLVGRTVSDIFRNALTIVFMALIALLVGWRTHTSFGAVISGFLVLLLFAFAVSWIGTLLGLAVGNPEAVISGGLAVVFPVVWLSNAFVPIEGMAPWMQAVASWNPVSSVVVAVRDLLGNPNPVGADPVWPLQHPVAAALLWSAALLLICVPLAARSYRRKAQ
ncbi:ABC transporter permease [Kibdelosporangium phytohabitans]|uniref:Transport permease protein n=1 Tax=Kibdelosporangium phytohabitans TaxID=860235 RepID=A0A0N9I5J2_9PSEU|nr:ABC transporter permease [Kibdelosporangium phytohabitans]ALG10925.1 ABC transporter [Kibdelosporangium phytohabitans]MBE1462116.1 ABC transporter DrrB family efflux protein [Kibdelosporangium phytohabitans]